MAPRAARGWLRGMDARGLSRCARAERWRDLGVARDCALFAGLHGARRGDEIWSARCRSARASRRMRRSLRGRCSTRRRFGGAIRRWGSRSARRRRAGSGARRTSGAASRRGVRTARGWCRRCSGCTARALPRDARQQAELGTALELRRMRGAPATAVLLRSRRRAHHARRDRRARAHADARGDRARGIRGGAIAAAQQCLHQGTHAAPRSARRVL